MGADILTLASTYHVAGAVSGFRVCIDIDKAPGKHALDRVLGMLDLERDYPWAVATPGKGGGWHVWITVPDLGEALAKLDLTAGKLEAPFPGADHIELRWERCQALLPGSAHPEGGTYSWVHGNGTPPSVPPAVVEVGRVLRLAPWADKGKTKRERVKNPAATVPESYLLDELEGAAERIRKAPDGRQNDTIYAATRGLGELAHYGLAY